jgi:hypothetical protein
VDRITVNYTPVVVITDTWPALAAALQTAGWVPAWLSADDNVWAIPREDIDPARTLLCARDTQTGATFATWIESSLTSLPTGPAPVGNACALAWCNAVGAGREAAIDAACP